MRDRALATLVVVSLVGFVAALATALVSGAILVWKKATSAAPVVSVLPAPERAPAPSARPAAPPPTVAATPLRTATPTAEASAASTCPTPPPLGIDTRLEPLQTADVHAVDPQALFPAAKRVAMSLDPDAELQSITAQRTRGGTVDLSGTGQIAYRFEYVRNPGTDARELGSVDVTAGCWGLFAKRDRFARIYRHNQYDPVPDPRCSAKSAWRAAVASGIPEDTVTDIAYRDDDIMVRGSPSVWSFTVPEQPSLDRKVLGTTCTLLRPAPSSRPVTPGSAPSASPGHAADDDDNE